MPRISTYGSQNSALMDLMRAQQGVFDAQQQVTTGKKATDLKGIGHKAETLSASRASLARSEAYQEAATRTASFLESQEIALERINSSMTDLRVAVTEKQGLMRGIANRKNPRDRKGRDARRGVLQSLLQRRGVEWRSLSAARIMPAADEYRRVGPKRGAKARAAKIGLVKADHHQPGRVAVPFDKPIGGECGGH